MGRTSGIITMEVCGALNNRIFLFLCACVSGILFALVWRKYEQTVQLSMVHSHYSHGMRETNYDDWLRKQAVSSKIVVEENLRYSGGYKRELESSFLYSNVPILCLVFVNNQANAHAIKNTWATHCNSVTFFGKFHDEKIPVLKVPPVNSFESFCYAYVHVSSMHRGRFKWVVVADDSTYVIVENLRYYVAPLNSSLNYYLGHPVKDFTDFYNLGSAGIVLSNGSMSLLSTLYKSAHDCMSTDPPSWYLDQALGRILSKYSVHPVDTRDAELRTRFNPFSVEKMLIPGSISVFSSYWRTSVFLSEEGHGCCSDNAITFRCEKPSRMQYMEYIMYHLAVFRNSFKGLGNMLKGKEPSVGEKSGKQVKLKPVGEPFVKLLDGNVHSKVTIKPNFDWKEDENELDDIFNNLL